jgi:glycosyltransferase involved in cell wall biosynthesis
MIADPLITVIIPTSCESSRADFLNRSIKSIETQQGVQVEILLVCNGNKQDEDLINALNAIHTLKIVRLEEGNVSKARYEGLRNSNGEYFCFLDDDDEFLEGSLSRRLEIFQSNPAYDVVVTNGLLHTAEGDEQLVSNTIVSKINSNPSMTFLEQNWFASPASMYKKSTVGLDVFNFQFKYFEWTYLFFSLISLKCSFIFDKTLTYRKYEDHPLSVSKTIEYYLAYPDFLQTLKQLDLNKDVIASIHTKYIAALNSKSNILRQQRKYLEAWKAHLLCLANGGFKYISYTRHLLSLTK